MKKIASLILLMSMLAGCAGNYPSQAVIPQNSPQPITETRYDELKNLPAPASPPIVISVYSFRDLTGQRKPNDRFAQFSSAVTQGAEVFLIKALQDAGKGKWFRPVERVGLDDLIKERQLIRNQRETYEGQNAQPIAPLLISGIMIQGGIVGYDSNVGSGGIGAALLGINASTQYRTDEVTVVMRLISVHTGEVLISAGASKTILSTGINGGTMKFVDLGTKSVQIEAGINVNEPTTYAVRLATEAAVVDMIKKGADKGLWKFTKPPKKENGSR